MIWNVNVGQNIFEQYTEFSEVNWLRVWSATKETVFMSFASVVAVFFLGLVIVLLLFETQDQIRLFSKIINRLVAFFVNVFRSIPFIILIVLLLPFTKEIVGRITGPVAGIPALIIAAAPFFGRLVEIDFCDVYRGLI